MTSKIRRLKGLLPGLLLCAQPALALRPFESTDADVLAKGEVEVEIGAFTLEHQGEDINYVVPHVVYNYGLGHDIELGAELAEEKLQATHWQLIDPVLFMKTLLRHGALQDQSGFSIALETSALLPAQSGEHTGAEAALLVSNRIGDFSYHFNAGGGENRDKKNFVGWGVIGALPLSEALALVSEFAAQHVAAQDWQRSLLVGLTFTPRRTGIKWDAGVRSSLTSDTTDLSLTFGVTVGF